MRTSMYAALAACLVFAACAAEPEGSPNPLPQGAKSPLDGAWELIRGEYTDPDGRTTVEEYDRAFQLKLFTPTHFAYLMRNADGTFREAGAGRYTLTGDTYREVHGYQSQNHYVDYTASWRYRISGDTLYMEGPAQVLDAAGNTVTEQISQMKEVRTRAR
jgi:hypothetical protein